MFYRLLPYKYKKWATVIGGFLIHFSLGSYYSFGNLSPYMISYLREYVGVDIRYSKSIWISTLFNLAFSAGTLFSGFMNSKYKHSLKLTIFLGCLIMTAGVALTFFTIKLSYFLTLLTYGVMIGIGTGFSYIGPMSIAMKWFPDRKGLANSAILFGYGASAIIFDQVQTFYINPNNYAPDKPYSSKFPDEK